MTFTPRPIERTSRSDFKINFKRNAIGIALHNQSEELYTKNAKILHVLNELRVNNYPIKWVSKKQVSSQNKGAKS